MGNVRGYCAIGIINSKRELNVGGALRAAHCFGAALVLMQGRRYGHQASDTTKMTRHVPLIECANVLDAVPSNCVPIAVELTEYSETLIKFRHPERALYIFGPEDGNVPESIRDKCRTTVQIPTTFCLNLAATVNVVLYDRLYKQLTNSKPQEFRAG